MMRKIELGMIAILVCFLFFPACGGGGGDNTSSGGGVSSLPLSTGRFVGNLTATVKMSDGAISISVTDTAAVDFTVNSDGTVTDNTPKQDLGDGVSITSMGGSVSGNNFTFSAIIRMPECPSIKVTYSGTFTSNSLKGTISGGGACTFNGTPVQATVSGNFAAAKMGASLRGMTGSSLQNVFDKALNKYLNEN